MKQYVVFTVIIYLLTASLSAICQNETLEPELILALSEPPSFPGGVTALLKFIDENKKYPEHWRIDSIEGKVFIQIIIDSSGNIISPKIIRSLNPTLDSIAVNIIIKMPKWSPGKQEKKPVAVQYILPINFGLEPKDTKNKRKKNGA